jgi:hypothetical protein
MSKLDLPLKVKHGLAAAVAALALGVAGTAIPMATAGGGGGLHYVDRVIRNVDANSQEDKTAFCPDGTKVVGGGVWSGAGFSSGSGMMINTSAPDGNDAWEGAVDVFANAGGQKMKVYAICKG